MGERERQRERRERERVREREHEYTSAYCDRQRVRSVEVRERNGRVPKRRLVRKDRYTALYIHTQTDTDRNTQTQRHTNTNDDLSERMATMPYTHT